MRRLICVAIAVCGLVVLSNVARADFIGVSDGNTVTATDGSHLDASNTATSLVNGSGMSNPGPGDPWPLGDGTNWVAATPVTKTSVAMGSDASHPELGYLVNCSLPYWYLSASNPAAGDKWIKFVFTNATSLKEMVIWNMTQNINHVTLPNSNLWHRGMKGATITYSTADDTGLGGGTIFTGNLTCGTGLLSQPYTDDFILPTVVAGVKAVKIVYTGSYGADFPGDAAYPAYSVPYTGLSEVRFDAGVPEPGTLALLAAGLLGLLCYAWRKRK